MAGEFLDSHVGNLSPTPILDGLEPPPDPAPQNARRRFRHVPALMVGLILGMVWASASDFGLVSLFGFLLFLQIGVAVHEAGHVTAGALAGFSFRGIEIGGFAVIRTLRGWRLVFQWKRVIAGGRAYMIASRAPIEDWRYAVVSFGGPLASFLFLAAVYFSPLPAPGKLRTAALMASAVLALSFFLPRIGAVVSDISLLLMLARKNADWRRLKLVLPAQTLNVQGVRPRDWDRAALREAIALEGGSAVTVYQACTLAAIAALDSGDFSEAGEIIERELRISHLVEPAQRGSIFLSAAQFCAKRRNDPVAGRAWLERARTIKAVPGPVLSAVEAVVLCSEGSFDQVPLKATPLLIQYRKSTLATATLQMAIGELEELITDPPKSSSHHC